MASQGLALCVQRLRASAGSLQHADQVLSEATPALEITASHFQHEMVYRFATEHEVAAAVESQSDKTKIALKRLFEEAKVAVETDVAERRRLARELRRLSADFATMLGEASAGKEAAHKEAVTALEQERDALEQELTRVERTLFALRDEERGVSHTPQKQRFDDKLARFVEEREEAVRSLESTLARLTEEKEEACARLEGLLRREEQGRSTPSRKRAAPASRGEDSDLGRAVKLRSDVTSARKQVEILTHALEKERAKQRQQEGGGGDSGEGAQEGEGTGPVEGARERAKETRVRMTAALRKLASSTRVGGAMARVASALVARPRDAGPAEAAEVQQAVANAALRESALKEMEEMGIVARDAEGRVALCA